MNPNMGDRVSNNTLQLSATRYWYEAVSKLLQEWGDLDANSEKPDTLQRLAIAVACPLARIVGPMRNWSRAASRWLSRFSRSTCRPTISVASFKLCLSQLLFSVGQVLESLYVTLGLSTVHTTTGPLALKTVTLHWTRWVWSALSIMFYALLQKYPILELSFFLSTTLLFLACLVIQPC